MDLPTLLDRLRGGLVVSCQAFEGEALFGADVMVRFAKSALEGGAVGIRANSPADIAAIHEALPDTPLIGLYKYDLPGYAVRITPTLKHAIAIAEAGCDIVALDATDRPHPEEDLATLIRRVKEETGKLVLADISTFEEGVKAEALGADLVGSTMSGYTDYSPMQPGPDLKLVAQLASHLKVPVIAEGRIATPEHARLAIQLGAFTVVVGGAITRPQWITSQFVKRLDARD